jgi:hypothetical protein
VAAVINSAGVVSGFSFGDGVGSIAVGTAGSGYTQANPPVITFTGGGTPTTVATALAEVSAAGAITGFLVTNPGAGYSSAPTVVINNGVAPSGGTLATGTATLTSAGKLFTAAPTVTILPPTATPTAVATMSSGAVNAINLTSSVVAIALTNGGGTGYTASTTANLSFSGGGGGTGAAGTFTTNASGVVTSLNLTNAGSGYTSAPTISFGTNNSATAVATIATGGAGYTTPPVVTLTGGGSPTTAATATAILTGGIVTANDYTGGAGYT